MPQFLSRNVAVEVVLSIKELWAETRAFLEGKAVSEGLESTPKAPTKADTSGGGSRVGYGPCPRSWTRPRRRKRCMAP